MWVSVNHENLLTSKYWTLVCNFILGLKSLGSFRLSVLDKRTSHKYLFVTLLLSAVLDTEEAYSLMAYEQMFLILQDYLL